MLRQQTSQAPLQLTPNKRNPNSAPLQPRLKVEAMAVANLLQEVQQLEEMIILDGTKFPLTGRKLIDEQQLLDQVTQIEQCIPEAVQAAENIVRRREEIVAQAQAQANSIIQAAQQKAEQIANTLRIRQQAELEAQQLRDQVQQETSTLRLQVQQEMANLRQQTVREMDQIRNQTQQQIDLMQQNARSECQRLQVEADSYAEQVLSETEQRFQHMQQVLRNGRQVLNR
jgi:cell division septum initiation protein DivIVA